MFKTKLIFLEKFEQFYKFRNKIHARAKSVLFKLIFFSNEFMSYLSMYTSKRYNVFLYFILKAKHVKSILTN